MLGKTNSGGGGFDPSEIQSGTIAVDNILGLNSLGDIVKGNLSGQYVRVIPAPASTTLTDELIEVFKEGVFVNGTFLGMKNPVFFPCEEDANNYYRGIVFGLEYAGRDTVIYTYSIYKSTKYLQKDSGAFRIKNSSGLVTIPSSLKIRDKDFPTYPTNNTTPKVLQIASNGGSLSWGDRTALYKHTLVTNSGVYANFLSPDSTPVSSLIDFFNAVYGGTYNMIFLNVNGQQLLQMDGSGYEVYLYYASGFQQISGDDYSVTATRVTIDLTTDGVASDTVEVW